MEFRQFGRTGLKVSAVGFGCWEIGGTYGRIDESQFQRAVAQAIDSGIICFVIIRGLADQLQQRTHGGPSRALQRRLRILAGDFEKGARSFDPNVVLKTGAILVRQWRGQHHTVLVREDGYDYEGERYRSLTVIAERITGAHWSGPRFFGLTKRARALVGAQTG